MSGFATTVAPDALARFDPAHADRYAVYACHAHSFTVLAVDKPFPAQMQCRLPVSASAICGAVATRLEAIVPGSGDFPVSVLVTLRRGVEWIKRRPGR